jgi:hypothetical protein
MKNFLLPFFGFMLLLIASCESDYPAATGANITNPKTLQAIVSVADSNYVIIQNSEHPATLSNKELKEIDTLLNTCINNYNAEREKQFTEHVKAHPEEKANANPYTIDLSKYMLQYQPSINNKGEKEVWIEGFCDDLGGDWRKPTASSVQDGGKCFFRLNINLHLKRYTDFAINSEA